MIVDDTVAWDGIDTLVAEGNPPLGRYCHGLLPLQTSSSDQEGVSDDLICVGAE